MDMRKIYYVLLFLILFGVLLSTQKLYANGDAKARYDEAIRYIEMKQVDFAFMQFRNIIRDFPESPFAQKSIFAIAEYSYDHMMYYDAIKNLREYINDYPDSKTNVFAKAYLLKIIEEIKNPTWEEKRVFEDITKEFFSKPLFLLFTEYKETSYRSPSLNKFKIRYYIDNIEVYRNDKLFIKISQ
jgi:outer membrane protein assembly factor BamD (BamD/ComL family)